MVKIKITTLKCLRCGHSWYPRNEKPPKICPVCKRTNWNKEPMFYNTHPFQGTGEQCTYDTGYAGMCGCKITNPIHEV